MHTAPPSHTAGRRARRRPHRSSERGSALIIALLVILALTALGMVGLKQVSTELRTSANSRYATQGTQVSDAGMAAVVDFVGRNGQSIWEFMSRQRSDGQNAAIAGGEDPGSVQASYVVDFANVMPPQQTFGGVRRYGLCDQRFAPECRGMESEQGTPSNFQVVVSDPTDGPKAPGFSQNFCFKRFRLQSVGSVGNPGAPAVFDPRNTPPRSVQQHVAYALVGPLDCGGYYN